MGTCISKKSKIYSDPSTSSFKPKNLSDLAEVLTQNINRLHKNFLKCREKLQQSLLHEEKSSSIFFIFKELALKNTLNTLRELSSLVGVSNLQKTEKKVAKSLLNQGELVLRDVNQGILDENFEFLSKDDGNLRNCFNRKFGVDSEVFDFLEKVYDEEIAKVKSVKAGGYTRIKYFKKRVRAC
jgi:hypothetical protein